MTRGEKRLAVRSGVLGVLLTLVVVAGEFVNAFEPLERWLYDARARQCQFFLKPPTERLVYIDIDDQSLLSVDSWPWPRTKIAEIVDEVRLAGAKVLAFDVVFAEAARDSGGGDNPGAGRVTTRPAADDVAVSDQDAALAAAVRRFGHVLLPASFDIAPQPNPQLFDAVRGELATDLELTVRDVAARLRARGNNDRDLDEQVGRQYVGPLRAAAYERVASAMAARRLTFAELRRTLLPRTSPTVTDSALLRLLRGEYQRWLAQEAMRRFSRKPEPGLPPLLPAFDTLSPIEPLARAAWASGFVDYLPNDDGVVRTMPLWLTYRDGLYPQAGLSLACAMLGVDPSDPAQLQIADDAVTLTPVDRPPIVIPVRTIESGRLERPAGACMDIPWFGGSDWVRMHERAAYDPHVSADIVWQVCQTRRSLAANSDSIDAALLRLLGNFGEDEKFKQLEQNRPPPEDIDARLAHVAFMLKTLKETESLEPFLKPTAEDLTDEKFEQLSAATRTIHEAPTINRELAERLIRQRGQLRQRLEGKAVLLGWTATAAAGSDFVPTSLHARAPGVIAHGAIVNGILSGELWRSMRWWQIALVTFAIGAVTTAAVTFLSPWKAVAAALAVLVAYLLFNGLVLFDYLNLSANSAGSGAVVAAGIVYSGLTLMRLLVEGLERARITKRFRSYVDPTLVDYMIEHPDTARFEGEVRELTVVFTDLTDFTALSEKLGEATVSVLNRYFDRMVPVINKHRGHGRKFLGDGIMFFFGAPMPNPDHAADAVATVLEMRTVLAEFNRQLAAEGLEPLEMRAGVSTGRAVVGDAGSADASDYTVLGDAVNVGSRLESAGKITGTRNMISGRTAELLGDRYLLRPIGKLQVAGKTQTVMSYEALCATADATEDDRVLARLTSEMVTAYFDSRFDHALHAIRRIEDTFGEEPLTRLYRHLCERHQSEPPAEAFAGEIVLAEK